MEWNGVRMKRELNATKNPPHNQGQSSVTHGYLSWLCQGLWGGFQVITTKCSGFYSLSLFYFSWLPLLFNWYFLLYLVLFSGIFDSYSYIFRKSSFIIFFFLIYIWLLFLFRILEIQELSCAFRSFWWFYSSPFQTSQPLILL